MDSLLPPPPPPPLPLSSECMPAARTPQPYPRQPSIHLLNHYVLPFLPDGVPLAFAAAAPQLRLCAEAYRAEENFRIDSRTGALTPRTLGEPDDFAVYQAKARRRCGVQVGPLLMTLHVCPTTDATDEPAARARATVHYLFHGPASTVGESDGEGTLAQPGEALLPPAPSLTAKDVVALHESDVLSGTLGGGGGGGGLHGFTAVAPLCGCAATHDALTAWAPPTAACLTVSEGGRYTHVTQQLVNARCAAAEGRYQRSVAKAYARRTERKNTRATAAEDVGCGRLVAPHGSAGDTVEGALAHTDPPLQRGLFLWAKEDARPAADGGSPRSWLDLSRWWLARPLTASVWMGRRAFAGGGTECAIAPATLPVQLHVYSADAAQVEAACRGLCARCTAAPTADTHGHDDLDSPLPAPPPLWGLHIVAAPPYTLRLRTQQNSALLSRAALASLRVLQLVCRADGDAVQRMLAPPSTDAAEGAGSDVSWPQWEGELATCTPCLEVLRLQNHTGGGGLLAPLFPRTWAGPSSPAAQPPSPITATPLLPALAHVDLSHSSADNATITSIGLHCRHLATLRIHGCRLVTDLGGLLAAHARALAPATPPSRLCHTLWSLDAGSTGVTAAGIAALPALRALTQLCLFNCAALVDVAVLADVASLRRLDLRCTPARTGLARLGRCAALQELLLSGEGRGPWAGEMTEGLFDVRYTVPGARPPAPVGVPLFAKLTRLYLEGTPWFNDAAFAALVRCAPPLEVLGLVGLSELTSLHALADGAHAYEGAGPSAWDERGRTVKVGAAAVPEHGLHTSLETLRLAHNGALTTAGVRGLAACRALRHVQVHWCRQVRDLSSLAAVPTLRSLSVAVCEEGDEWEWEGGGEVEPEGAPGGPLLLSGFDTPSVAGPRELEQLLISHSSRRRELAFLGSLPCLCVLDLSATAVTAASLQRGVDAHCAAVAAALPAALVEATADLPAHPRRQSEDAGPPPAPRGVPLSTLHTVMLDYCESLTSVSCLARLPSLRRLSLRATPVTNDGLRELLFGPWSGVESLDLTGCQQLTLHYDVARCVRELWTPQGADSMEDAPHAGPNVGVRASSQLRQLIMIGLPSITDVAMTALFLPIPSPHRDVADRPRGTFFSALAELDMAQCPGLTSVEPLLPLAATLRRVGLRYSRVSTAGLQRLPELTALAVLDLQGTTYIRDVTVLLTHPSLLSLDLRGATLTTEDLGIGELLGDTTDEPAAHGGTSRSRDDRNDHEDSAAALLLPGLAPPRAADLYRSVPPTDLTTNSLIEELALTPSLGHLELLLPHLQLAPHPLPFARDDEGWDGAAAHAREGPARRAGRSPPLPRLSRLIYSGPLPPGERAELLQRIQASRPLLVVQRR